MTHSWRWTQ